ncbi:hypothetical protein SAMN05216421_3136 [Halopseudomonas xinjiangensis]|uniref:NfeD-like C-terminal domain-containing protein n=1 Tax=Halopseudomonas xinjiangensis TaxID=487184 RepID=A0A1H1YF08_9GAMM|nr:NfeD family protein [Halopseudomonas xinjiangensis]SDT20027.1 hypothetical protein SAMN05216421_3136 [Halopseudomonas xinjiangensis]
MLAGSLFTSFGFWLLLGLALLISEFFVPGLIALFFGVGALIVGLLTWLGFIDGLVVQLLIFSGISLVALLGLRRHCMDWFSSGSKQDDAADLDDSGLLGARVRVASDFANGVGAVQLNGAKWDAESDEPLKIGDAAWVVDHRGIVLTVSGQKPANKGQKDKGA